MVSYCRFVEDSICAVQNCVSYSGNFMQFSTVPSGEAVEQNGLYNSFVDSQDSTPFMSKFQLTALFFFRPIWPTFFRCVHNWLTFTAYHNSSQHQSVTNGFQKFFPEMLKIRFRRSWKYGVECFSMFGWKPLGSKTLQITLVFTIAFPCSCDEMSWLAAISLTDEGVLDKNQHFLISIVIRSCWFKCYLLENLPGKKAVF